MWLSEARQGVRQGGAQRNRPSAGVDARLGAHPSQKTEEKKGGRWRVGSPVGPPPLSGWRSQSQRPPMPTSGLRIAPPPRSTRHYAPPATGQRWKRVDVPTERIAEWCVRSMDARRRDSVSGEPSARRWRGHGSLQPTLRWIRLQMPRLARLPPCHQVFRQPRGSNFRQCGFMFCGTFKSSQRRHQEVNSTITVGLQTSRTLITRKYVLRPKFSDFWTYTRQQGPYCFDVPCQPGSKYSSHQSGEFKSNEYIGQNYSFGVG